MAKIYRVSIRGRVLESCDLRNLLSRAVREKRKTDDTCGGHRADSAGTPGLEGISVEARRAESATSGLG